ncbi:MAG: hypothetical protein C0501_21165, partial [Isosphaera sp.]|nr:hypothetical protein [Isosphaera sp.]
MSTAPVVFVSSTVHDLKDLRSALRYWLGEWGFCSRFSEFNDFPQLPDLNSYDSCLKAIDEANYFVLLIGHRIGGWYDKERGVSITQKEYQYAYDRARAGQIKIIPFVRRDLWTVLQDRGDVTRAVQSDVALAPDTKAYLAEAFGAYGSKFADDAKHIFGFVEEVTRKEEMRKAGSAHTSRPAGNWVYTFETFGEIVDTLRVQLGFRHDLRQES